MRTHWSDRLHRLGDWLLPPILALVAVQPLLGRALPLSADGLLHFYRLAQLDRALRHGILFPRWAPDMGFGYGFPLFNYYAPLSYYVAEPLHLIGLSTQGALLAAFALAILVGSIGVYLWTRDLFGRLAGLVAAVAFAYAPYTLFDVVHRGALAEAWGLAWIPFVLWALRRGQGQALPLPALFYAALLLTHNILALVATPLFAIYAVILWALHGRGVRRALLLGGALALGLGLAAFFWAPAFFERGYVQIQQLYALGDLDYHNNFVNLRQLFATPQQADPALIHPAIPFGFGWPQLALALVGLVALRRVESREARLHLVLLGLGLLASTAMALSCSLPVWDGLPLLRFVQFPWRFLGPATLFLATLAGAGAARLPGPESLRLPAILLVTVAFSLTWLFPRYNSPQAEPTPLSLIAFEQETGWLGTTSAGDYLPVWVRQLPTADSLVPAYQAAGRDAIISRLVPASLPAGAQVVDARYGLTSADLTFETPEKFTAIFSWYYFPGWQGRLDGQSLALQPTGEHGLIGAVVPAGRHRLIIRFGDTPLRRGATIVSGFCLMALLAISFANRKSQILNRKSKIENRKSLVSVITVLTLFTLKTAYLDHHNSIFRASRFDGQSVARVQSPLQVNFDNQMTLLGYDLTSPSPPPGRGGNGGGVRGDGVLDVALYWRALRPLDADYSVALHLVDEQGHLYGQRDSQHPAGSPTSSWEMGTYARDLHRLAIRPGTPPGEYWLVISVYDLRTGDSLDLLDAAGAPTGTTYRLAAVQVTRPTRPPDPGALEMGHRLQANLGPLTLMEVDLSRTEAAPGDPLLVTLYWLADETPTLDLTARLTLLAADGSAATTFDLPPTSAAHPTTAWRAGDLWHGQHTLLLPAHLESGDYTWRLTLFPTDQSTNLPTTIHITAPPHVFTAPAPQHPLTATLDGQATLLGYDLSADTLAPGQPFTLTLYWRAEATAEIGYAVFVHLLDPANHIYAQSDSAPAAGARPTTGWLPGEIVRDTHTLAVAADAPPGRYVLEVGMVDPTTGERLRVPESEDRILLPTQVQVE